MVKALGEPRPCVAAGGGELLVRNDAGDRCGDRETMAVGFCGICAQNPGYDPAPSPPSPWLSSSASSATSRSLAAMAPLSSRILARSNWARARDFVGNGLAVVGEGAGEIGAAHLHQQLALVHPVSQARIDLDDASRSYRDHRHVARDVGIDRAGGFERPACRRTAGPWKRELLGMSDLEKARVGLGFDLGRRRRPACGSPGTSGRNRPGTGKQKPPPLRRSSLYVVAVSLDHLTSDRHIQLPAAVTRYDATRLMYACCTAGNPLGVQIIESAELPR